MLHLYTAGMGSTIQTGFSSLKWILNVASAPSRLEFSCLWFHKFNWLFPSYKHQRTSCRCNTSYTNDRRIHQAYKKRLPVVLIDTNALKYITVHLQKSPQAFAQIIGKNEARKDEILPTLQPFPRHREPISTLEKPLWIGTRRMQSTLLIKTSWLCI